MVTKSAPIRSTPITIAGIPFKFQMIAVTADPFAMRGERWIGHLDAQSVSLPVNRAALRSSPKT